MSKTFFLSYGLAAAVFLTLDSIWLPSISRNFYQSEVGTLLLAQPRIGAAVLFYLLYVLGIVVFCVLPGVASARVLRAAGLGLLFGVIAYATYDLTNLATLRGWSVAVVAVDIAWGGLATALAAGAAAWATRAIQR